MMNAKGWNYSNLLLAIIVGLQLCEARAEFSLPSGSASPGHGISNVLSGSIAHGALYWQSTTNWLNVGNPPKPYAVTNEYALPVCDSIVEARIIATVWGGTANYISEMTVTVNGMTLPAANPLVFGSTADPNPVFSATNANAYGSGSGVWLVTIPIPAGMLFKDGAANTIIVSQTSPDGFDGRVQHVTLLAVYQRESLSNTFEYSIAEGSGDIYRAPAGSQVSQRLVSLAPVNPENAIGATLQVLYTYGDANNDRLYFNGTQIGRDNVADWSTAIVNNGPSVLSFDVLSNLFVSNSITFSLGSDVPDTRESSLRPQLAALAVTRPAEVERPLLALEGGWIVWATNSAGFLIETTTNLVTGEWTAPGTTPVIQGGQYTMPVDFSGSWRFYRLKKGD